MSDNREFERVTKAEVKAAQQAWGAAVVAQDVDALAALYDYGTADEPLLFKPTKAADVRLDEAGTRSYFVGGNDRWPHDKGFLNGAFTEVRWESAVGPVPKAGGQGYKDMGHYYFRNPDGSEIKADYTFCYHKTDGRVLISLHHSSFNYDPAQL